MRIDRVPVFLVHGQREELEDLFRTLGVNGSSEIITLGVDEFLIVPKHLYERIFEDHDTEKA